MANKKVNFTIPEDILKTLNYYSKETMIPKSRLVSKLLKEFFIKNNEK
jgi:hypothetical protein